MKRVSVVGHDECIELVSGEFRLAVTTKVGPRVIFGSVAGSPNLFAVVPPAPLPKVETDFRLYGGHRLWHAPEVNPRTYAPDNAPVQLTELEDGAIEFSSGVEPLTGIEKSIAIRALGDGLFEVMHCLLNRGQWAVELAPWALSMMAPGGQAIIPFSRDPEASPYCVERSLNLWCYSAFTDPRLTVGAEYVVLRQDPKAKGPCKVGVNCAAGWVAYVNQGVALVKQFEYDEEDCYPDNGCSVESYTCNAFCEIETLGPLELLEPEEEVIHCEIWQGLSQVGDVSTEAAITANLVSRIHD